MQMSKSAIWGGLGAQSGVVPYITLTLLWGGCPPSKNQGARAVIPLL